MPSDYTPFGQTPAVTIDVASAEQALAYAGPPGGRPPGRINDHGGPATPYPGSAPPLNANAQPLIDAAGLKKGAIAVGATAAIAGLAYFLYQDHAKVTLARNGGAETTKTTKRRKGRAPDDDEDEDDDDA